MKTRRVRITNSDTSPHALDAFDAESGEPIPRMRRITIDSQLGRAVTATIETVMPLVDVLVDAEMRDLVWVEQQDGTLINPVSGEIRSFKE